MSTTVVGLIPGAIYQIKIMVYDNHYYSSIQIVYVTLPIPATLSPTPSPISTLSPTPMPTSAPIVFCMFL